MTEPFVGEIRINAFDYAPNGWALCNGQSMPIRQYTALFSLIGAYFGGDGSQNFNLPDMRGRLPVGYYTNPGSIGTVTPQNMGVKGGSESVTLTTTSIPAHTHTWTAVSGAATTPLPTGNLYATAPGNIFTNISATTTPGLVALNPKIIKSTGGSQPHDNMQPFLVLNFCIALIGNFPPRPW